MDFELYLKLITEEKEYWFYEKILKHFDLKKLEVSLDINWSRRTKSQSS